MTQIIVMTIFLGFVTAPVLVLGVWLARTGRQRRVGLAPHCPHCNYNLTGSRLEQCSECGVDLSDIRLPVGKREPSWPKIIAGGILILFVLGIYASCLMEGYHASRGSLYHLRPDFIVLSDLHNNALHPRAADELRQRLAAGSLSAASIDAARQGVIQKLRAWRQQSGTIYTEVPTLATALAMHPQTAPAHQVELLGALEQVTCSYRPGSDDIAIEGIVSTSIASPVSTPFFRHYQFKLVSVDGRTVPEQLLRENFLNGSSSWSLDPQPLSRSIPPTQEVRLRITVHWYDMRQHQAASAAHEQLPLRSPALVHSDRDVELLQQWIDQFALTPLGSVESELVLSQSTGWSATADSRTWQPAQPLTAANLSADRRQRRHSVIMPVSGQGCRKCASRW